MKQFLIACFLLATVVTTAAATEAPKGNIIYCCYANTRNDGWGRHFCELINEKGKTTVVVYYYNRNMEKPDERHYEVGAEVAEQMEAMIREKKYYEIDGYKVIEHMMGGSTKRVYMEFSTGEHINAEWFAEKPDKLAESAYLDIVEFFKPWLEIAKKEQMQEKSQTEETVDDDIDTDSEFEQGTARKSSKKYYKKKRTYSKKTTKRSKRSRR
jgi:hypothetical protein